MQQHPPFGVHGGFPQFAGVHLSQAFEALDEVAGPGVLLARCDTGGDLLVAFAVGVGVVDVGSAGVPLDLVERGLREVDVSGFDERFHEAEQQGEQQRADVLAVDVGVGHEDDLVVPQLGDVEVVVDPRAQRGDDRLDLVVFEDPVDAAFSTLRILPRMGRIAW